jgi:phospholipid-binding lipoprotein MlaA
MLKNLLVIAFTTLLVGCASTGAPPADPLEGLNRATFKFNDAVDGAVLKPLAKGYQVVTPQFVRSGVSNAFSNVGDVGNSVNNLLQGKPVSALSDLGRLVVNSTLGILGLFDVATPMGLEKSNEDFGQTLGKWGMGSGPYVVLPLLGPSTLRDAIGLAADSQLSATSDIDHVRTRNSVTGLNIINIRAELLGTTKTLDEASLDKYQFLRDAFLQRRLNQVHDGKVPSALRDKLEESLEVPATPSATAPAKTEPKPDDKK